MKKQEKAVAIAKDVLERLKLEKRFQKLVRFKSKLTKRKLIVKSVH